MTESTRTARRQRTVPTPPQQRRAPQPRSRRRPGPVARPVGAPATHPFGRSVTVPTVPGRVAGRTGLGTGRSAGTPRRFVDRPVQADWWGVRVATPPVGIDPAADPETVRESSRQARPGSATGAVVADPARDRPLRLTRRGRLVLTGLGAALLASTAAFGVLAPTGSSAATSGSGSSSPTRTVVVAPGDTLWAIAAHAAGPGEIREMIHEIETLNALSGPQLVVGQELSVPVD